MLAVQRPLTCALAISTVLAASACAPSSAGTPAAKATTSAARDDTAVAPYLDVTGATGDIAAVHTASGLDSFTLAFVLADKSGACTPTWGSVKTLTDASVTTEIDKIHSYGGKALVASGGANGTYLETACSSPAKLAAAYEKVLDATGGDGLDIDIEKTVDTTRVAEALAAVQNAHGTAITLTLPVGEGSSGLTGAGQGLLRSVRKAGVEVTVNAMTMDFSAKGDWGTAMTEAAEAVHEQLAKIWTNRSAVQLYEMEGVTPMIGANDTGAVTTVADARTLIGWAATQRLGFVRFWSVNRDHGGCADGQVSSACSGVSEADYAFSTLFASFSH